MTEYWFGYQDGEPRTIYRLIRAEGTWRDEFYSWAHADWLASDSIYQFIINGEIGYERASKEEAEEFMRARNVRF